MPTNDALDPAQLPAGPALDRLIAEQVLRLTVTERQVHPAYYEVEWQVCDGDDLLYDGEHETWTFAGDRPLRPYSTDIAAAMTLLDTWQDYDIQRRNGWFTVELYEPSREYRVHAESLPLAIVRAALNAAAMAPEHEQ
jgi:hypothetical protein